MTPAQPTFAEVRRSLRGPRPFCPCLGKLGHYLARCSVCDRQSFARTTPSNRTVNRGSGENRCKREGRSSPGHFLSSGLLREYCEKSAFSPYFRSNVGGFLCS